MHEHAPHHLLVLRYVPCRKITKPKDVHSLTFSSTLDCTALENFKLHSYSKRKKQKRKEVELGISSASLIVIGINFRANQRRARLRIRLGARLIGVVVVHAVLARTSDRASRALRERGVSASTVTSISQNQHNPRK